MLIFSHVVTEADTQQLRMTSLPLVVATDSPVAFSLIDALDDDVLSLVLASLGVRWLGAAAQVSHRTCQHSRDAVLLRKVLHQVLTAHQWRVREDQLLHLPLASVLLLLRQQPDNTPLKKLDVTRLPQQLSVSGWSFFSPPGCCRAYTAGQVSTRVS